MQVDKTPTCYDPLFKIKMSSIGIIWFEWFNLDKQSAFEKEFKQLWPLLIRNSISKTVYRKWLREEITKENNEVEINEIDIDRITNSWLEERKISLDTYKNNKQEVLKSQSINEEILIEYCINELKAYKWAQNEWERMAPQIFLEHKDNYDKVKIKILYLPDSKKGKALEAYQMLQEEEISFENIQEYFDEIKYSTKPEGSWIRRKDLKPEIRHSLNRIKKNEISKPIKITNKYVISQWIQEEGEVLNDEIRSEIVQREMNSFLDYGVNQLVEITLENLGQSRQ